MSVCARCTWQPTRDTEQPARAQLLKHADQADHPLCVVCRRSLLTDEPQTCERCLAEARQLLSGIVTLWSELPRHLGIVGGQAYDRQPGSSEEHQLPGGAVLALLAPGGTGSAARRLTPLDLQRGLDGREHGIDNHPKDTPSVAWVLSNMEDDWRHLRGEPAAVVTGGTSAAVRAASRYLEVHCRWAANQHPVFDEVVTELRALHAQLEQTTGRRRNPAKAGADCFDCGGTLERPLYETTVEQWWVPGAVGPLPATVVATGPIEAENVVRCRDCGQTYDGARYLLALAARREEGLAGWVTVAAAAAASGRSVKTLRPWVQDGLVPAVCRVTDRRVLVWYPALHERTTQAQRRRLGA